MKRAALTATFSTMILTLACGPGVVQTTAWEGPRDAGGWTFVSEWDAVRTLAAGDDRVWAVTDAGLHRGKLGGGQWQDVKGLLPENDAPPIHSLHVDAAGTLWIAGDGFLASLEGGNATRFADVEACLGRADVVTDGGGIVRVGGGTKLASWDAGEWSVQALPFEVGPAVADGEVVWLAAGAQGLARIEGEVVEELAEPLSLIEKTDVEREAVGVAVRGDETWVLWAGDNAYLGVLVGDDWQTYTLPETAGDPVRLAQGGEEVVVQTTAGLFVVEDGPGTEQKPGLVPIEDPIWAQTLAYVVEPSSIGDDEEPAAEPAGERRLVPPPCGRVRGGKGTIELPARSLRPLEASTWSPVTTIAGQGRKVVVGTMRTGVFVVEQGVKVGEIAEYGVRPRVPVSSFETKGGEFFYVLADDRVAGRVDGLEFDTTPVANEHEHLLAFDTLEGRGYAVSLLREFETLHVYEHRGAGFEMILERPVETASGIKDIGGFLAHPSGSFWQTIVSDAEGLEMGVAVLDPQYEEIIYHGTVPMPGGVAIAIPDGVSEILMTPDGEIWLGGMEGAVRLSADLTPTIYREPQGLVGDMVSDLAVDGEGRVWALTADGLGWFEGTEWKFPSGPPYRGSLVYCIGVDAGGSLVIVDDEAVRRKSGDDWEVVVMRELLPGVDVLDVTQGAAGRLWVVTDRAIAVSP